MIATRTMPVLGLSVILIAGCAAVARSTSTTPIRGDTRESSARVGFTNTVAALVPFAGASAEAESTSPPACVAKTFKTDLVKFACAKGGQREASTAMKAFMREKKIKSCNQCHSKLAPKYELKADGLAQFQKAGGK